MPVAPDDFRGAGNGATEGGPMADALPAPLVPAGVDLRDFPFMPLEVGRLLRSRTWLHARRRPEIAFYLVNLWVGAWHEVPAGSLPDDDEVLADVARCTPARWRKLREPVMAAWLRCADGRLYHPVVAEKALAAWARKSAQRAGARKGNAIRWGSPGESPTDRKGQGKGKRQGEGLEQEAAATAQPERALVLWNAAAAREGWPEVMFLNGPRRLALAARLAEGGGLPGWSAALEAASRAEFLKRRDGGFHRWFDLDWLLQPDKFTRLMEGRYAERHRRDDATEGAGGLSETLAALGRTGSGR
jgi:uncharacterized protein YdaU (DUF1376 family)